jgi:hypothetical protein
VIALAAAELRVILRRRGLVWGTAAAGAVLALLTLVAFVAIHGEDPAEPLPGGSRGWEAATAAALGVATGAAVMGAAVAAGDAASGVLRYVLMTGVGRTRYYVARLLALLGAVALTAVPGAVIAAAGALLLPHDGPWLDLRDAGNALWGLLLNGWVFAVIAAGVGAALQSVGWAVAAALGLEYVGFTALTAIAALAPGLERATLPDAIDRLTGGSVATGPLWLAALVAAAWTGAFAAAGWVRVRRGEY